MVRKKNNKEKLLYQGMPTVSQSTVVLQGMVIYTHAVSHKH